MEDEYKLTETIKTRGTNMEANITDGVLAFTVNYDMFVTTKTDEEIYKMNEYILNQNSEVE